MYMLLRNVGAEGDDKDIFYEQLDEEYEQLSKYGLKVVLVGELIKY